MNNSHHILLVEDDESLSFVIGDNLEKAGYSVTRIADGASGHESFDPDLHDLCILDVMLPKMDGFNCAEKIREKDKNIPILFLTAKSQQEDKLEGFKRGGDDYITKPFNFEELLLRVEVFINRSIRTSEASQEYFRFGNLVFNYTNLSLSINENEIFLTQKEGDLLRYFLINKNCLLKRETILHSLWGDDDYFMGRSLDVFISRLRKLLTNAQAVKIVNNHGVGFKMIVD